ncbi:MAG TPA: cell wall hydrolase [Rhodothermales bacterium]|nr:cell wall hydrolase [Rhodothermales bacterium]
MHSIGKRIVAGLALLLAVLIPAITTAFVAMGDEMQERQLPVDINPVPAFSLSHINEDVLWLARCAYSETKTASEQELVAWVIRNRVETGYRGQHTYRDVVLDPYQFSAFNPGSRKRRLFLNLAPGSDAQGWMQALEVAHNVYYSPNTLRPFSSETRHFYSERSMRGRIQPTWARGETPVQVTRYRIDPRRFRFYSGIS